ncbi:MAG TPA: hypothetical protein VF375_06170 [Candidatus Limnocylindrales bacterium]
MTTQAASHERARLLAAESVDAKLDATDATWLASHLDLCPDCAAIAAEYRAIHSELRSLAAPEPPRDLWARTSAALDQADAAGAGRSLGAAGRAPSRRPMVFTGAAVGFVVVVAVASLLSQSPITHPTVAPGRSSGVALASGPSGASGVGQAPLANVQGVSYWISSDSGRYDIKSGTASCTALDGSCTVPSGTGQTLGSVTSDTPVSAVIAPEADQAAVWTADKVVILPLAAAPPTVSIDLLTPRPTVAATTTAVPATSTPASAVPATSTPASAVPVVTSRSSSTVAATLAASASPSAAAAAAAQPTAILSGYEIVGRDPEFSADGTRLAFSARPIDHSAGPDLFVWRVGQEQATPVTRHHSDMFAGWYGSKILISEISPASADAVSQSAASGYTSYVFDPASGDVGRIDRPMLLPTVDPTSRYLVYWVGSVEFDQASGLWQPGIGDLYFDAWSDIKLIPTTLDSVASPSALLTPTISASPSAAPSATSSPAGGTATAPAGAKATTAPSPAANSQAPASLTLPQLLPIAATAGAVHSWIVRWDAAGAHVAIWVADPSSAKVGRLGLFSVNPATGFVDTNEPLLAAGKVLSSFFFDAAGHLVYTSAVDGKTYMQAVPAVPPSSVSTPLATAPGQQASGADPSAAQASTRPGN